MNLLFYDHQIHFNIFTRTNDACFVLFLCQEKLPPQNKIYLILTLRVKKVLEKSPFNFFFQRDIWIIKYKLDIRNQTVLCWHQNTENIVIFLIVSIKIKWWLPYSIKMRVRSLYFAYIQNIPTTCNTDYKTLSLFYLIWIKQKIFRIKRKRKSKAADEKFWCRRTKLNPKPASYACAPAYRIHINFWFSDCWNDTSEKLFYWESLQWCPFN